MFSTTIDSAVLETLPHARPTKQIITVSTPKQLEKAVDYLQTQTLLGFDTETRPRFNSTGPSHMTALLQLSSPEISFLFHLRKTKLPPALIAILEDPGILKVGAAIRDDIIGLQRYSQFTPGGFLDLQQMVEEYGIKEKGVRKMAGIVLGTRVSKSQQTSNWEAFPLTEAQKLYAATDSYTCLLIYKALLANPQEKQSTKSRSYHELLAQTASLIEGETHLIPNLANVCALLKETFGFWWVGFYTVEATEAAQLVLGPFQGPLACTRIGWGKGVCGTAWKEARSVIVPNVEEFPGHIACSAKSKSEIVVPIFSTAHGKKTVVAVLDIDSERLNTFTKEDAHYLEQLAAQLAPLF